MTLRQDFDRLVDPTGKVRFGRFSGAIGDVNLDDADVWNGLPVPKLLRKLRLKEWEAFQITHERYFILLALFDAKLLQIAQVKLYDRQTGQKVYFEKMLPPRSFRTARNLLDSTVLWRSGKDFIRMENQLAQGKFKLSFDIAKKKELPAMRADLVADAQGAEPMVVSIPFGRNHGMYSHKVLVPLTGTLSVGDDTVTLAPGTASLMTDDHKGYYGRLMNWDWNVGAAWREGRLEGFNLTRNASLDAGQFNENGFWLGGELHALPPVQWEREGDLWTIRDKDGLVDVRFRIHAQGDLFRNFIVMESRYMGPIGVYEGTLRSPDGAELSVDGMFGMGERFWLRS